MKEKEPEQDIVRIATSSGKIVDIFFGLVVVFVNSGYFFTPVARKDVWFAASIAVCVVWLNFVIIRNAVGAILSLISDPKKK